MIDLKVWESHNGTKTPIAEMETRHVINAIQVIERNDPRYGVRHGAALPALLDEVKHRAARYPFRDQEAKDYMATRVPAVPAVPAASAKTCQPMWSAEFDPGALTGAAFFHHVGDFKHAAPKAPAQTTEERLAEVERKTAGPTVAFVDDRAARAHRRIDTIENRLYGIAPVSKSANARFAEIEARMSKNEADDKAAAADLTVRTEDLWRAVNGLVDRVTAVESLFASPAYFGGADLIIADAARLPKRKRSPKRTTTKGKRK